MTETFEAFPSEAPISDSFPWPPAPGASAAESFFATWKETCFHPASFFRRMPREGPIGSSLIYYLIIGVIAAGVQLFWHSVLGGVATQLQGMIGSERLPVRAENGVVDFLLSPLLLLFTLYCVSGICHLFLMMVRGARNGFQTTTRVFTFSYSPILFVVVPVLGNFIAIVWMTALAIHGLRAAHETTGGKAAAAVLIPLFLVIMLIVLIAVAALAMGVLGTKL